MKVLVVEDTMELAALVQMALEGAGWEVDLAYDGATALAMAGAHHQVVLVDLGLPDMPGEALVRHLRAIPQLSHTPVIWFTAQQGGVVPEGGVGMITKPFDPMSLAGEIAELLS